MFQAEETIGGSTYTGEMVVPMTWMTSSLVLLEPMYEMKLER